MDANEYLEKLMADTYKREIDQEENVVRSLPFVAAVLAVLSTIMIFTKSYIPSYPFASQKIYGLAVWTMLFLFGCLAARVIIFLYFALSRQSFQYVSSSSELYSYSTKLANYHTALGRTPTEVNQAIIEDMRILMIQQYAIGAGP